MLVDEARDALHRLPVRRDAHALLPGERDLLRDGAHAVAGAVQADLGEGDACAFRVGPARGEAQLYAVAFAQRVHLLDGKFYALSAV